MLRRIFFAAVLAAFLSAGQAARADDSGYFLSWHQKKELVWLGRIQDSQGNWYDVWICPGYLPPAKYAWAHLKKTGADFHEYVEANKYHSLKEGTTACLNWAFKECGLGFTIRGIPRAWGNHFSVARTRTQQRVFGWWMAYPWAFLESSLETVFRGALGSIGTVGGTVSGLAIVPVYHALDSAVVGVWDLGANTIILPAAAVTWNTIVSPPLALIGQKPAESRVDGFWVVEIPSVCPPSRPLTSGEIEGLGRWGMLLLKVAKPFEEERRQNEEDRRAKEQDLHRQIRELQEEAAQKQGQSSANQGEEIQRVAAQSETVKGFSDLTVAFGPGTEGERQVRAYLASQQLPGESIDEVIRLLGHYPSPQLLLKSNPVSSGNVREKTDPLRRSGEILGNAVDDKVKETIGP